MLVAVSTVSLASFICSMTASILNQKKSAMLLVNSSLKSRMFETNELGSEIEIAVGAANIEDEIAAGQATFLRHHDQ